MTRADSGLRFWLRYARPPADCGSLPATARWR
jgi:hypothetical protein